MAIDAVEMNTFIDVKNQKFYLVDIEPASASNYETADNGLSGMAAVCILAHKNHLIQNLDPLGKRKARTATRTILSKVLAAGQKTGLTYSNQLAAEENIESISDTLDRLEFFPKEKNEILRKLLTGSICQNQILGHLTIRKER